MSKHKNTGSFFKQGNQAILSGEWVAAIQAYIRGGLAMNALHDQFEGNLTRARRAYRREREGLAPRLAICGWSLSHNPAGRVMALVDAYLPQLGVGHLASLEVIGALFPKQGEGVWGPMGELPVPLNTVTVEDDADFLCLALAFVAEHPFDAVLLSKPRFPNLIFGLLYQLIWGATVLWDIDDEELAFADEQEPISLEEALNMRPSLAIEEPLNKPFWTRLCVGQIPRFPVASVSNPALQKRYGGVLIPHVRDEQRFVPCENKRGLVRQRLGIPEDAKVVLFLGTPRVHKGLLETAQGLASLQRDDLWFVIVGSFTKAQASESLKQELQAITGVHLCFLEDQPFSQLPEIAAAGDYCALLQNAETLVSRFQLPAKLVDALAMKLVVFAQVTPATQWLADANVVVPVSLESFPAEVEKSINSPQESQQRELNRFFFEQHLSVSAVQTRLNSCITQLSQNAEPINWHNRLQPALNGSLLSLLT